MLNKESYCSYDLKSTGSMLKYLNCSVCTEAVISSTAILVAIANNTLYESKLYIFLLCQKSLDIKIMLHEDI